MNGLAVEVNLYDFIKYISFSYRFLCWNDGAIHNLDFRIRILDLKSNGRDSNRLGWIKICQYGVI
jgi:hypothetical protein